jgi:hypothetical protein
MNTDFELPLDAQARIRMWEDSLKANSSKPVTDSQSIDFGRRVSNTRPDSRPVRPGEAN